MTVPARVVLFGAGRMGGAMATGWLADLSAAGVSSLDIVEPAVGSHLAGYADRGARINAAPSRADVAVIAVKPQMFDSAAPAMRTWIGQTTLVISIMAGVTLGGLAARLGAIRLVRAMPNTPAAIGMGVTGWSAAPACDVADIERAQALLAPLGDLVGPLDEQQMDAVTAVSGSGPAYFFLLTEALAAAGKSAGLSEADATILARKTAIGAGALLQAMDDAPSALRQAVTSPGGVTAAALALLAGENGLPKLMLEAVEAAVRRSRELAGNG